MPTFGGIGFGGGGGLTWAKITATSGATTGTYTSDGILWRWYQWTGNGTVTIGTAGIIEGIVIGGGSFPGNDGNEASGGRINQGIVRITSGSHNVTVGAAAAINGLSGASSIGSFLYAGQMGSAFANQYRTGAGGGQNGFVTNLTGSNVTVASASTGVGFGNSSRSGAAIIRIPE